MANAEAKRAYDRVYSARWRAENPDHIALWRAENPDRVRLYVHKRRARKYAAENDGWTDADLAQRAEETDAYGCFWCGSDPGEDWHRDHIFPLSRGGSNRLENITISCAPCNLSKNARIAYEEWTPPIAEEPTP
ncbi:HNH endonuclease [Streptomyces pratens]|uniref:HNH endonuclease n=1 Tax=Streptomyces pratens TaxID=887456 RepID=A0ABW1M9R9_9ACTN